MSAAGAVAARLDRDPVTWTGYAGVCTWGCFLYAFGATLPLIRDEQGISRTVLSLHSVMLAVGGVLAGLASVGLTRALGRRGAVALGAAGLAAGIGLLVSAGTVTALTMAACLIIGCSGSTMVNALIAALSDHHGRLSAAALTEANGCAALAGIISPALVGGGVALGIGWRPAILLGLAPLAVAVALLVFRSRSDPSLASRGAERSGVRQPLPRSFFVPLAALLLVTAVEFCCASWSADLLRQRADLSAGLASAAVSALVGGMAVGRLVIGRLALSRRAAPLFVLAVGLTVVGWALVWTATSAVPALVGLVVTGLGIAGHYPLGTSMALALAPAQRDQAVGAVSIAVGGASGLGPFFLGSLADATSTHTAFVVVPVLLVLAGALVLAQDRRARAAVLIADVPPTPFSEV